MLPHEINIGKEFSRHPAGRFPTDGKYNGETFRKKFLMPHLEKDLPIRIYFDDAIDYGSSFLEEAFGGLIRVEGLTKDFILNHIELVTEDTFLKHEIFENIKDESNPLLA